MINRVLIRIKVIQLLYSYLLMDQNFELESAPVPSTREKLFAYSLYIDLLALMTRIAGMIEKRGGAKPLKDTRFIRQIEDDMRVQAALVRDSKESVDIMRLADAIKEDIEKSPIYQNYIKKKAIDENSDVRVWEDIFRQIILSERNLTSIIEQRDHYSVGGMEKAREMVFSTFSQLYVSRTSISDVLDTLKSSMDTARELYFGLLQLPVDLTFVREQQIDEARHKVFVKDEDRYPNLRFVENQLAEVLKDDPQIASFMNANKVNWLDDDRLLMEKLLSDIMQSELYKEYMENPVSDFNSDCEFWKNALRTLIYPSEDFLEFMENKSVFWNDDLEIIGTFVIKTIRKIQELGSVQAVRTALANPSTSPVLPQYKDAEDERFGRQLFTAAVHNRDRYQAIINECLAEKNKWEFGRLAFMDVVIIITALAEIETFEKIPLTVSVNEYIEMAKYYSTPKSAKFVHGILGNAIDKLRREGKIYKNN